MEINEIFCIGSNKFGQSGAGKKYHNQIFAKFNRIAFPVFIKQVVCGSHHSGLLTLQGLVYMMGSNINGALGSPTTINYSYSPILVETLQNVSTICSGYHHMCAVSQGKLYSWGKGVDGQLGTGKQVNSALPAMVESFGDREIQQVSCGLSHTLVRTENKCYAFGNGIYGQLGIGGNKSSPYPVLVKIQGVTQIAAGENFSLFLKGSVLYGSGDNSMGQISYQLKKKYVLQPTQIKIKNVTAIRAGKMAVAVTQDKFTNVWGFSKEQVGITVLKQIDAHIMDLQTGGNLIYCLSSQGSFYEWRSNDPDYQMQMKQTELRQKTILGFSVGQSHSIILGDIIDQVIYPDKVYGILENILDEENSFDKSVSSKTSTVKINSEGPSISSEHYSRTPSSIMRQPNNFLKVQSKQNIHVAEFLKQNIQKVQSKHTFIPTEQAKQRTKETCSKQLIRSDPQISQYMIKIEEIITMLEKNSQLDQSQNLGNLSMTELSRKMAKSKMSKTSNKQNKQNRQNKLAIEKGQKSSRELIMELRQKQLKISELQQKLSRKDIQIESQRQLISLLRKINTHKI